MYCVLYFVSKIDEFGLGSEGIIPRGRKEMCLLQLGRARVGLGWTGLRQCDLSIVGEQDVVMGIRLQLEFEGRSPTSRGQPKMETGLWARHQK